MQVYNLNAAHFERHYPIHFGHISVRFSLSSFWIQCQIETEDFITNYRNSLKREGGTESTYSFQFLDQCKHTQIFEQFKLSQVHVSFISISRNEVLKVSIISMSRFISSDWIYRSVYSAHFRDRDRAWNSSSFAASPTNHICIHHESH